MTFAVTRRIAFERLSEVLLYLNHISSLELAVGVPVAQELKIMKGMFFVILYGALEKSTHESVQLLLLKIKGLEPKNNHVIHPFYVVSMARRWKSIKETGYKDVLTQMSGFFTAMESNDYLGMDESLFAAVLQNVWAKTIEEVVVALGVPGFSLPVGDRALIDELVRNRNAVAHGRESASEIGERYRIDDLRRKLNEIQLFIVGFIDRLEVYYEQREFLCPENRILYG